MMLQRKKIFPVSPKNVVLLIYIFLSRLNKGLIEIRLVRINCILSYVINFHEACYPFNIFNY